MNDIENLLRQIEELKNRIAVLERAELAVEAAGFDVWENNFATGEVFGTNRRTFESLGYPPDELPSSIEETFQYIHPEDLDSALEKIREHLEGKTERYQSEMRVRAKDGTWVWIGNYGKVIERDLSGTPTKFLGLSFNINQRRIVEEALVEQNSELKKAMEHIKVLQGIIPICSHCKKVRNDKGYWGQVEDYISSHTDLQFSHSICPDCLEHHYQNIVCKTHISKQE